MLKEYMSKKLIIVDKNTTIEECSNIMKQYNIGFLPINNGDRIVGVITDRDIVVSAISNFAPTTSKIEKYISRNIVAIDEEESVISALKKMGSNKIKRLLVTSNKKVVGIISLSDLINTEYNNEILETVKEILEITNISNEYHTEIDEFYL